MSRLTTRILLNAATTLACSLSMSAQEKHIPESQLPKAVLQTIQQQSRGAEIKGYSTEREHGQKVYEAETLVNGHSKDLQVAEDGTLNEVEEEVTFDDLSPAVKDALTKKARGARITKVESFTKKGKLVAYEAATLKGSKKGEVQVGPLGETLDQGE